MRASASPEFLQLQEALAGRFSLERELGRGGMAVVFLARDVALDRPVAIKLLPEALAVQPELRDRFLREARTAAKLSHPNVVPIHLVEAHESLVFFVMTYVDGETLGQRVRRAGPLPPSQVTRLIREAAWALAYAHGRGIVHRDVKPDNILLDKDTGRAMLTDFGIASVRGAETPSRAGEIVGTVRYMSPEQASGEPLDGRSDLFSLGVTAYYALTGTLPFDGVNVPAIVTRIVNAPAPPLADVRPGVPYALAAAVDRCLAKRPEDRFASGEELAEAIGMAVVTNEVAPQLRHFLRAFQQLDTAAFCAYLTVMVLPSIWSSDRKDTWWIWLMLGTPAITGIWNVFRAARHVIKAGLGPADVRLGFERELRARREEAESVALAGPVLDAQIARRRRYWMLSGHVNAFAFAVTTVAAPFAGLMTRPLRGLEVAFGALAGLSYLASSSVERAMRKRADRTLPQFSSLLIDGLGDRLMRTWVMPWLFRVARLGLDVRAQNEPPARERTELLIASAVSDLFARLPQHLQTRFADVPRVIKRLESEAEALRKRPEGHPADERLATAVAALESLRLDMLRLEAGVGTADDLTADLERARAISEAVNAEVRAVNEVESIVRSARANVPHPADQTG
jgi:serine/threonine-protein kinase